MSWVDPNWALINVNTRSVAAKLGRGERKGNQRCLSPSANLCTVVLAPSKNVLGEIINAAMLCVEAAGSSDEQSEVPFKLGQQRTTSLPAEPT